MESRNGLKSTNGLPADEGTHLSSGREERVFRGGENLPYTVAPLLSVRVHPCVMRESSTLEIGRRLQEASKFPCDGLTRYYDMVRGASDKNKRMACLQQILVDSPDLQCDLSSIRLLLNTCFNTILQMDGFVVGKQAYQKICEKQQYASTYIHDSYIFSAGCQKDLESVTEAYFSLKRSGNNIDNSTYKAVIVAAESNNNYELMVNAYEDGESDESFRNKEEIRCTFMDMTVSLGCFFKGLKLVMKYAADAKHYKSGVTFDFFLSLMKAAEKCEIYDEKDIALLDSIINECVHRGNDRSSRVKKIESYQKLIEFKVKRGKPHAVFETFKNCVERCYYNQVICSKVMDIVLKHHCDYNVKYVLAKGMHCCARDIGSNRGDAFYDLCITKYITEQKFQFALEVFSAALEIDLDNNVNSRNRCDDFIGTAIEKKQGKIVLSAIKKSFEVGVDWLDSEFFKRACEFFRDGSSLCRLFKFALRAFEVALDTDSDYGVDSRNRCDAFIGMAIDAKQSEIVLSAIEKSFEVGVSLKDSEFFECARNLFRDLGDNEYLYCLQELDLMETTLKLNPPIVTQREDEIPFQSDSIDSRSMGNCTVDQDSDLVSSRSSSAMSIDDAGRLSKTLSSMSVEGCDFVCRLPGSENQTDLNMRVQESNNEGGLASQDSLNTKQGVVGAIDNLVPEIGLPDENQVIGAGRESPVSHHHQTNQCFGMISLIPPSDGTAVWSIRINQQAKESIQLLGLDIANKIDGTAGMLSSLETLIRVVRNTGIRLRVSESRDDFGKNMIRPAATVPALPNEEGVTARAQMTDAELGRVIRQVVYHLKNVSQFNLNVRTYPAVHSCLGNRIQMGFSSNQLQESCGGFVWSVEELEQAFDGSLRKLTLQLTENQKSIVKRLLNFPKSTIFLDPLGRQKHGIVLFVMSVLKHLKVSKGQVLKPMMLICEASDIETWRLYASQSKVVDEGSIQSWQMNSKSRPELSSETELCLVSIDTLKKTTSEGFLEWLGQFLSVVIDVHLQSQHETDKMQGLIPIYRELIKRRDGVPVILIASFMKGECERNLKSLTDYGVLDLLRGSSGFKVMKAQYERKNIKIEDKYCKQLDINEFSKVLQLLNSQQGMIVVTSNKYKGALADYINRNHGGIVVLSYEGSTAIKTRLRVEKEFVRCQNPRVLFVTERTACHGQILPNLAALVFWGKPTREEDINLLLGRVVNQNNQDTQVICFHTDHNFNMADFVDQQLIESDDTAVFPPVSDSGFAVTNTVSNNSKNQEKGQPLVYFGSRAFKIEHTLSEGACDGEYNSCGFNALGIERRGTIHAIKNRLQCQDDNMTGRICKALSNELKKLMLLETREDIAKRIYDQNSDLFDKMQSYLTEKDEWLRSHRSVMSKLSKGVLDQTATFDELYSYISSNTTLKEQIQSNVETLNAYNNMIRINRRNNWNDRLVSSILTDIEWLKLYLDSYLGSRELEFAPFHCGSNEEGIFDVIGYVLGFNIEVFQRESGDNAKIKLVKKVQVDSELSVSLETRYILYNGHNHFEKLVVEDEVPRAGGW